MRYAFQSTKTPFDRDISLIVDQPFTPPMNAIEDEKGNSIIGKCYSHELQKFPIQTTSGKTIFRHILGGSSA
jgi:hypothetical protein